MGTVKTVNCPSCDAPLYSITVKHLYFITFSGGKYRKSDGVAHYRCSKCRCSLSVREITDILKEVNEL